MQSNKLQSVPRMDNGLLMESCRCWEADGEVNSQKDIDPDSLKKSFPTVRRFPFPSEFSEETANGSL